MSVSIRAFKSAMLKKKQIAVESDERTAKRTWKEDPRYVG